MVDTPLSAPPAVDTATDRLRTEAIAIATAFAPAHGAHDTAIRGLQLVRTNAPGARVPAVYEPGLALVLQGRKETRIGTEALTYDPLHCLVVSVTMLPRGQVIEASPDKPYLCVRLSTDLQALASLVLDSGHALPPSTPTSTPAPCGLQLTRCSEPLLDAVLRLLRLLHTPIDAPVLAPLVMREVFYRVLTGELGPQLRALAVADSQSQRIGRAIDLLKRRYAEPVRIDEVAEAAHMSPSSLHLHFKQVTSMSPLQYQKQLRLHQARQLMLAEGLDAAAAAHRVGYESPSQFSREYRRLFGAPPRAEVRQTLGVASTA